MAAVARTVLQRGQKLTRQATSTTEDTYTITTPGGNPLDRPYYLQMVPTTVGLYYHQAAGLTQTDGFPIAAGQAFTIQLGGTTVFYLSAQTATGTVDFVVV